MPGPRSGRGRADVEHLEFELIDVLRRHDLCRSENDLAVPADHIVAKPAGGELLAFLATDLAHRHLLGDLIGQIAEVGDVPPNVLGLAGEDVLLHQRRRGQSGELHFGERASLLEGGAAAEGRL